MIGVTGRWLCLSILTMAPAFAQTSGGGATGATVATSIGGGTCNAATLSGVYAISFAGHQNTTGSYTDIMQANGIATFDGTSAAMLTLTQDNLTGVGQSLSWTGTYTVQSDCQATITIPTSGVTLQLTLYDTGAAFLLVGSDSTFVYVGQATNQPTATCSTTSLKGVYTFSARGYNAPDGAVAGAFAISGLAEFDGQGHVTVVSTFDTVTSTGTYSLGSNCTGSATINVSGASMTMALSVYAAAGSAVTDLFMNTTVGSNFAYGAAHYAYDLKEASGL